jgi:glycosyltransferase involved in cell wall biosynthesis
MKRLVVLLPVLNEAEGLRWVLERIPYASLEAEGYETEVLVIDGNSTDQTEDVAAAFEARFLPQEGTGKGSAIRYGFREALAMGSEVVVMLDADGTYAPEEMLRLLKPLKQDGVVIGDRLRGEMAPHSMSRLNYIGNHLLTWLASGLYGTATHDVCSGYWAFSRDAIERMMLNSVSFEIEAEMYASMVHRGIAFTYRPISYRPRLGEAKLGSTADGWNILRKLITRRFLPQPLL